MQVKQSIHAQDKTIASIVALGVFSLAVLFVAFVLPAVPSLMEKSQQQVVPMNDRKVFDISIVSK